MTSITSIPRPGDPSTARENEFQVAAISQLRVGTTLRTPIFDNQNVLLLAKGHTITTKFLQKLRDRQIEEIRVSGAELSRMNAGKPQGVAKTTLPDRSGALCELQNRSTTQLDSDLSAGGESFLALPAQQEAFANQLRSHGVSRYDEETCNHYIESHEASLSQMESVYDGLATGKGMDVNDLSKLADETMKQLAFDQDLFSSVTINPQSDRYPVRHSLHTSLLAMSLGTQMQLDQMTVRELAIGCLIHDAGMLKIDQNAFNSTRVVDNVEFLEITKHPIVIFDMIAEKSEIPQRSRLIAYQMHERCNGQGYPRRRDRNQIHLLSRIAAVADTYIALVSPRPHRPGMMPYRAVERIIKGTGEGLFDPKVTRALLQTISLFPIGSYFELEDGRVGRVLRANGENYNRPIVELWDAERTNLAPDLCDMKDHPELKIARAIPELPSSEQLIMDQWE